jgi:hypothetical protein
MPRSTLIAVVLALARIFSLSAHAQFQTRASTSTTTAYPNSLVVGDFNGDGILDLASITLPSNSGNVEILLGNGDGTFRSGATYTVGLNPAYGVAGSLRRNGTLDLVLNDGGLDNVWVMLGNGDGTFQPAVAYPTTAKSYMVALGNFTGSGNLDIAAPEGYNAQLTYDCNCVEVLPGNGDGTFGAPITTLLPYGLTAYTIVPGDFNNDGKLDVAAAGESFPNYEVAILLGNGNGSFDPDGHYLISGAPSNIATGYFTSSKKKLDLAVVPGLDVVLGNGNGTFQAAVPYPSNTLPSWVIAEDFDGDGKVDLVTSDVGSYETNPAGVSVYRGNGDGTFQKGVFYHVGSDEGGWYVAAGDFNGDGKPDLVVVNQVNSIITTLLNTGVVSFSPTTPLNFKKQAVGTTSSPQSVKLTNTGTTSLRIASMKASTEFAVTSTCGSSVAAGANCTVSATFSPTKKGSQQGTITIIDSASTKPQVIELIGTGT